MEGDMVKPASLSHGFCGVKGKETQSNLFAVSAMSSG
jgi:hypothetical protein